MDDHSLRRLADDPGVSLLGRSLIASAQDDVPTPDGRARAAKRLGIAAVLAVGTGASSEAGAFAVAWKLVVVLLALGGVVGLAIRQSPASEPELATRRGVAVHAGPLAPGGHAVTPAPLSPPSSSPSLPSSSLAAIARSAAAQPPAPPRPPSRVSRPGLPSPVALQLPAVAPPEPTVPRPETTAPDPAPESGAAPASEAPGTAGAQEVTAPPEPEVAGAAGAAGVAGEPAGPSRLAAEVALVDRARTSLRSADYASTLAALAEYRQRFASGDLDAEADVVMIETLIAVHSLQRARSLGTAFFARFPRSPLAQRVHSLLDRLPK